jgi:ribosomal protein L44E
MNNLCSVLGHVGWKTIKLPDKTAGYCPKCNPHASYKKGIKNLETYKKTTCDKCGTELKHPKTNIENYCTVCGYNQHLI